MRRSVARLAAAAKRSAEGVEGSVFAAPGPYTWLNPESGPSTGPLAGRSVAVKDNISYKAAPTECASRILEGYTPPYNATCVDLLIKAGAHISGKTKMDEFGMGSENTHIPPSYGPVHNPEGPASDGPRAAGGSSGGSAVAVAEGSSWAALGTDTGGSVRLPASYCGVVGLKPSYGMVSRFGVVAYADSLDCVGILGKDVSTVSSVFGVVSAPDGNDMTCASEELRSKATKVQKRAPTSMKGMRIGIPGQTHADGTWHLPPALLEYLRSQGATLHAVDMPALELALPAYYIVACAEAASNLGRFGGGWYGSAWEKQPRRENEESGFERRKRIRTEGFGYEVRKRILAGTHALTKDAFNNSYLKALELRRRLRRGYDSVFRLPHPLGKGEEHPNGVDVLLHPTATSCAPKLHGSNPPASEEYLQDVLTASASLAGLPAMSVPAGREEGWPVGVSVVSQWGMEEVVFTAGKGVEAWAKQL